MAKPRKPRFFFAGLALDAATGPAWDEKRRKGIPLRRQDDPESKPTA